MSYWHFIRDMYKKHASLITANMIALLVAGVVESSSVVSLAPIIDIYTNPDLQNVSEITLKLVNAAKFIGLDPTLTLFILLFIGFIVVKNLFLLVSKYLMISAKYSIMRTVLMELFTAVFGSNWQFFASTKQGTLLNTFGRELDMVGTTVGATTNLLSNLVRFAFFMFVPFYISWKLTLVTFGLVIFIYVPSKLIGRKNYQYGLANTNTANIFIEVIHESLAAAKVILGIGLHEQRAKTLYETFSWHKKAATRSLLVSQVNYAIYEPTTFIILFIVMYLSLSVFKIPLSESLVMLYALRSAFPLFTQVIVEKNGIYNLLPSYDQIQSIIGQAREQRQLSGTNSFQGFHQEIKLQDVSFAYNTGATTLKNVNISIPKGKVVAIVGKSGAGKSTLVDLLMGFYAPTKGSVQVDGKDLREFDIYSYRRKIGYVPQDSVLFHQTIRENLLWGNEEASQEQIEEACKFAHAHDFILQQEKGYDTVVGDRGAKLSGGQKQRLALARAVLRQPELLVLDEATSSLDSESEQLIQQAIEKMSKDTTVVIIAHRLSTVVSADRIYVLEEGEVAEMGNFKELMGKRSKFFELASLQGLKRE